MTWWQKLAADFPSLLIQPLRIQSHCQEENSWIVWEEFIHFDGAFDVVD
jgi:hypothetical protein